jgi:autotransporter-associated beta strand protein
MKIPRFIASIVDDLKSLTLLIPLAAAAPFAQAIPTDSLIHYDFDSVSGTTVTNTGSLGTAGDGILANASLVTGQFGNGLNFTGNGSGVRTIGNVAIGDAFTLACWVSTTNSNSNFSRIIVNDYGVSGYLGTNRASAVGETTKYLTIVKNQFSTNPTSVDVTGTWHHLAMTWDGANQKFYYDGVLASTTPGTGPTTLSSKFGFGCNSTQYNESWNGKMDDAFIFGRALSLEEVQSLYTNEPNAIPAVPTAVAVTPTGSGTVNVSWSAALDATSHVISYKNTATAEELTTPPVVGGTSYSVTGLTNGTLYDFKVLATNTLGSSAYSSVVSATPTIGSEKSMLTFAILGQPDGVIAGTNVTVVVPVGTDVSTLSATYTLSAFATGAPVSGTPLDFTTPQSYTITAQDGSTQVYTVTVSPGPVASAFTWTTGNNGNWSDQSKWLNDLSNGLRPTTFGQSYYTLNFNQGVFATNDLSANYVVNTLNFGAAVILAGNSLTLTADGATQPTIKQNSVSPVSISAALNLAADTTLSGSSNGEVNISGVISGTGNLIKTNGGTLIVGNNNTYTGNTTISSGTLAFIQPSESIPPNNNSALGASATKVVTIGNGATLSVQRAILTGSQLVMNGGTYQDNNGYGSTWNGAVILNANSIFDGGANSGPININGVVSGVGGLTRTATGNTLVLNGVNTYTGPTVIAGKTLQLGAAGSIDTTPLISIAAGATFDVSTKSAFVLSTTNILAASGAATTANLRGGASGTVDLGLQPVILTYNGVNPALTVSEGTLVLNGNPFTINSTPALAPGSYTVATQTTGVITSSGTYPSVIGTAIGAGQTGTLSVSGSNVVLTVSGSANDFGTWLAAYPSITSPADKLPTADPDGDGLNNQQEYAFGLSPASGSSVNPITVKLNKASGKFTYTRRETPATTGLSYVVQTSTNLVSWTPDTTATQTVTGTTSGVQSVEVTLSAALPLTAPATFVRVKAAP